MIQKVLIAIHNDEAAQAAAHRGLELADQLAARAGIVFVIEPSVGSIDAGILPQDQEDMEREIAQQLIGRILSGFGSLEVEVFIPTGSPHLEIDRIISEWEADLLIIGHHTHSFFSSPVEKSLRHHLHIPILIIPAEAE